MPDSESDHPELARRYRREFPILEHTVYLNSNSLGALSRRSMARRREFEEQWNRYGASAWYEIWLGVLEEVREGFGATIGARPEDVALMPNVSTALAAVAGALEGEGRRKVVVTDLDFPTLVYQFLSRRRLGLEVEVVESPDGVEVPLERIADALDDRTALLATSHVFFTTGAVQDARALARIAHERGSLFLLDAYQSNGQMALDVEDLGADFLVSGSLKWLLGGPGLAYLYVRPELQCELQPTTLGWFGVRDPFAFDPLAADPRPDARRFEMGTPSVGAAFTAAGGLEIVREAGIPAIEGRVRHLARDLADRLTEAGYEIVEAADPDRRSGLVLFRHPEPQETVQWLARHDIVVDARPERVRLSPHFYNTVEDNARAVEVLMAGKSLQ